jgi:hypothetical protein
MLFKTLFRTCVNYLLLINKSGNNDDGGNHTPHVQHILKLPMLSIWLKVLILQISVS